MKDNCNNSPLCLAVTYVCTSTADWQKYEAFVVKREAQKHGYEIVAEYRDYEGSNTSSNRQGFIQMLKDIKEEFVPSLILVSSRDCLPADPGALGIDLDFLKKHTQVGELIHLGRKK